MYQDHPHWQGHKRNHDNRYEDSDYRYNEERERGGRGYEGGPHGRRRYEDERDNRRGYYENEQPHHYYGDRSYRNYDEHDYGRESRRMRRALEEDWRGGNAYPYSRNEYHQQYYREKQYSPRTGYNYGGGNEYEFSRSRNYGHNNAGWVPERGFRGRGDRPRYRDEYNDDRYYNDNRRYRDDRGDYRNNNRYREDDRRRRY